MQFAASLLTGGRGKVEKDSPGKEKPFPPCEIRPTPGVCVSVSCAADGMFLLEWRDDRRREPTMGDDARPPPHDGLARSSGSVAVPSIKNVVALLRRIVFCDSQRSPDELAAEMASESAASQAAPPHEIVLHFQRADDRAAMRRVTLSTGSAGQLKEFSIADGASSSLLSHTQVRALMDMLKDMCSGPHPFVLVRPPMWAEMPPELWGNVVNRMTQREGRAVSCSCKQISQIVKLPSFIWVHEKMHLDIVQANDAVRNDKRTNLPFNLVEGEIFVGRSRNNKVVLLRDTELSKEHCKLWRDVRGDLWIQDLASTNGTKVNGQFLKADEGAPANASGKRRSHPRQLKVDDTIRIGLTTLAVKLGSVERQENASQAAGRLQDSVNNGQGAGEGGVEGAAGGTPLQGAAAAS